MLSTAKCEFPKYGFFPRSLNRIILLFNFFLASQEKLSVHNGVKCWVAYIGKIKDIGSLILRHENKCHFHKSAKYIWILAENCLLFSYWEGNDLEYS